MDYKNLKDIEKFVKFIDLFIVLIAIVETLGIILPVWSIIILFKIPIAFNFMGLLQFVLLALIFRIIRTSILFIYLYFNLPESIRKLMEILNKEDAEEIKWGFLLNIVRETFLG